jgi:[ribosomal protein S5]-alanine N-acetyltransferase
MQIIETERLILRPFREGDAADLFAYLRAPTAPCFLSLKLADLAGAEAEVRKRAVDEGSVAICLKQTGQVIGDLFGGAGDEEEDGTASVGWHLNPQFGGRGYAFEAAKALFDHLFRVKGFRRLYAYVEDHNTPSQRLCEKLGMRREGVFIEFVSFTNDDAGNPIYENTMQYAILRREWMSGASAV